jgi:hypothetical protein
MLESVTITNASGSYGLNPVSESFHEVVPVKNDEVLSGVDADDATLALAAAVGAAVLTPEQALAADVTGNGEVTSWDASLILQRAAGTITEFPVEEACGSAWLFFPNAQFAPNQTQSDPMVSEDACFPGSIILNPLVGQASNQNFQALVFGDVDGDWTSPGAGGGATSEIVDIGRPLRRGKSVHVPIELVADDPHRALHVIVEYDPTELTFQRARSTRGTDAVVAVNDLESGALVLGIASDTDIETGEVLNLEFAATSPHLTSTLSIRAAGGRLR